MTKRDATKLDVFLHKSLRRLMEIYWPMKISNKEIRKRATSAPSVSKSSGGVGSSLVTFSEWIQIAPEGRRNRGRPKENSRRTTEKEITALGFGSWSEATVAARDRVAWQRRVSSPIHT